VSRTRWSMAVAALALSTLAATCGGTAASASPRSGGRSGLTASDTGVTPSTITIGLISSFSGPFSSTFADTADGARARFALQNAHGGVDGRKLKLITADDESSLTATATATQALLTKHPFGVIGFSGFLIGGAYRTLQQAGVPVTGGAFDGPEWGLPPNTNMFTYTGGVDPHYPASTLLGKFLKSVGAKSVATLAFNNPSSTASILDQVESDTAAGLSNCYENTSIPNGAVDLSVEVLAIKNAKCDATVASFVDSSDIALSTQLQQAGLHPIELYYTGYDQSTLDQPSARQAAQGDYFLASTVPLTDKYPGAANFLGALKKYDPSYTGGIPDFGLIGGWLSADLMIRGLEAAGKNPTRQAFIKKLRAVKGYDAEGLLPSPVTFQFGQVPKKGCAYVMQLKGDQFVVANGGKPACGQLIPNSNTR